MIIHMRAFTLLEILVYITLLSVMIAGMLSTLAALNRSLANARAEALELAEQLLAHDSADQGVHAILEMP